MSGSRFLTLHGRRRDVLGTTRACIASTSIHREALAMGGRLTAGIQVSVHLHTAGVTDEDISEQVRGMGNQMMQS